MKVRCINCGALASLDALISNEAASEALKLAFDLSGDLGKAILQYLGLFRPASSQLSFDRVAKLLSEINTDIEQGKIKRNQQSFNAPKEAWIYAIAQIIKARDAGSLTLPMKSHGYLYEIISAWRPEMVVINPQVTHPSHQIAQETAVPNPEKEWTKAEMLANQQKLRDVMKGCFNPIPK